MIFKADYFTPRAEIIYIPDIDLNEIPMDDHITDPEVLTDVLHYCYTGEDFVEACGGNVWKAERLFWYVDWQNPCSAVDEIEDDELDRTKELLQAVVDWMVGTLHRRVAIATLLNLDFTPDELIELSLGSDNVNEVLAGYEPGSPFV